jgi:hypothetical protein
VEKQRPKSSTETGGPWTMTRIAAVDVDTALLALYEEVCEESQRRKKDG